MNNVRQGPYQCSDTSQQRVELINCELLKLLQTLSTSNDYQGIQSCRTVTAAGSWGSIGDNITEVQWYKTNGTNPVYLATTYYNETLQGLVTGITSSNSGPCSSLTGTVDVQTAAGQYVSAKVTDGTNIASVRNTGSNDSLNVAITDASGNQITSFGGGTQYAEGTVNATPTGTVALWKAAGNTLESVSSSNPLPITVISGANLLGAASAALQTAGNISLSSIDGKIPALGQALNAASVPVVLTASQFTTLTPPAAITGFATSTNQTNASQKTQIVDGSGSVIASTSNALNVAIVSGGGSGGTASSFGSAFPATGTAAGFLNSAGTNMAAGNLDGSGFLKVNASSSSFAAATGFSVPVSASYGAVNVAGTLRGITGAAPSGSIFAMQIDEASIAGTTKSVNNGTTDAGTTRVTISSDSTGQVKLAAGAATIGALTANQSVNLTQLAGSAVGVGRLGSAAAAFRVVLAGTSTATPTNVAASATSVTALASNTARAGATFFNDSTSLCYIQFGAAASSTSYVAQIQPSGYYEVPFGYAGSISASWTTATGNMRVMELS